MRWEIAPEPPKGDKLEKDGEEVRAARADGGRDGNSGNYGSGGVRATQADRGSGGDYGRGEKGKTLSEFWDFDKVYLLIIFILINMFYQTNFLLLGSL